MQGEQHQVLGHSVSKWNHEEIVCQKYKFPFLGGGICLQVEQEIRENIARIACNIFFLFILVRSHLGSAIHLIQ